jgi:exosortase
LTEAPKDQLVRDGVVEAFWADLRSDFTSFLSEFDSYWRRLPNRGLFLVLLAAWAVLFQFLGNGTFGYIDTPSLFHWMWNAYNAKSDATDDGHGNVVPFVVLGLFWWKRKELFAVELRSWWPGLLLLAAALALHMAGYLVQQPRVSILAMFLGIFGIMGMAWGSGWLRRSLFPFALFLFSVPVGSQAVVVTFPLRMLVTILVAFVTNHVLGLHIVRVGTGLFDAKGSFAYDVAAACSGIRSLMAMFLLCTAYGYVTFRASWRWLVMILAAFPLSVLGNMLRLLVIVLTAQMFGKDAGLKAHDSTLISMLPYVPAVLGVILLVRWLGPKQPSNQKPEVKA